MRKLLQNYKTSAPGIAGVLIGVAAVITGKVAEGITTIVVSIGLLGSKDYDKK